jgi:CrcB protein
MPLLLIGLGGFAGAIARYVVDGVVSDRTGGSFPWGTLVVNASGSFLLGLLFAMTTERALLPAEIRGPLMIGFIGAYTTFSATCSSRGRSSKAVRGSRPSRTSAGRS